MQPDIKYSKQTTLGNKAQPLKAETSKAVVMKKIDKWIEIAEIGTSTREDEMELKVGFRLVPSRTFFSMVTSDLHFDEQKIDSLRLRVLQGPLATDESEFSTVLDMTGIGEGKHVLRIEMYELWDSGERLYGTSREAIIEYAPVKREDRLIRIPTIKSTAGADLEIVSDSEKRIYREINEEMKKESEGKRDYW